ncbi:very-long-chain (3R)-3-hydroxyacyl-CoA dehydratase isoform X1 [Bactrocera dorsalis]|uniref:Very-long-chain (3R)-3-hydroxyacyl-CoA dehydratase n=1 Tax=Bactrocera dorsalis TaxID=27457 RepID=A0ABM3IY26_BACDO|nr:very-long-chain (3R)-3-hydroxyacyl-CoA dehydratase isoform X1 [Bactrocera dorsalis]
MIKNTNALQPLVFWAQTREHITLRIDLKDSSTPLVNATEKCFEFSSKGYGACGFNEYKFELNFYDSIYKEQYSYRITDTKVEFVIKKNEYKWWPRLVAAPQKPHWLRIDFDRWRIEDEMIEDEKPRNIMEDYSKELGKVQKEELGYFKENAKKVYLIFYNLSQFIGYLYILIVMGVLYYRDGIMSMPKIYESVGHAMKFCQLLQYLEVLHPIFGYTKGGVLMPFFQVMGRNFILFAMIELEERMQTKPVIFYIFLIWSCIEIIRYPYYLTQIFKCEIFLLTWLRYTVWIPLYPIGILCEGIIILRNLPYFEETKKFSLELPNKLNIYFDMPAFMKIYLLFLILPGTYLVMSHMAKTRGKKLNGKHPNLG